MASRCLGPGCWEEEGASRADRKAYRTSTPANVPLLRPELSPRAPRKETSTPYTQTTSALYSLGKVRNIGLVRQKKANHLKASGAKPVGNRLADSSHDDAAKHGIKLKQTQ